MYQQPWGGQAPQGQQAGQQQAGQPAQQPWGAQPQAYAMAPQQAAWGTDQAAQMQAGTAAAPAAAAAAPAAAQAGYAQYYKQAAQQAAPVAAAGVGAPAGQPVAAAGGAYPYAAAAAAAVQQPRLWVGTVTQLIPPNYGVVDGDAYYINAVVVGDVPKLGDKVRVEGVPHTEGSYKWRVTRLQLESLAAAADAAAAAKHALAGRSGSGPSRYQPRSEEERNRLREEAAGKKYNAMAPPVAAYTSEVALASVETALGGSAAQGSQAAAQGIEQKRALIARSAAELDEEARRKAEQAVQQLGMDPAANPGAKMLARMGFGTTGTGLGRRQQGISAPIDPVSVKGGTGLGFDLERAQGEERAAREERQAAREARDREEQARDREEQARRRERRRSRSRSRSPGRGRYACSPPKAPTYDADRAVAAMSKRYKDLYLPSDFVKVRPTWQQTCPECSPYPIDRPISFEIKETEQEGSTASPATKDAPAPSNGAAAALSEEQVASGRCWSARVVLVSGVNRASLEAGEKDAKLWVNPLKKLSFLLIKHDKHEYGMVGGHWEPQDGGHPASDPTTLTRTAVRTFKAATGLDLSSCTQWIPFCEFSYLRPESSSKGLPERTEHTVVYLVDAWSLATHNDEADTQLQKAKAAAGDEERARRDLAEAEAKLKELEEAAKAAGDKAAASKAGDLGCEGLDPPGMNVQQLQEELTKRGLDTKWNPLKGKKELVDRLQEWMAEYRTKRAAEDADFRASEEAKAAVEAQKDKVRELDRVHREARSASRSAEKLLLDPPPTEKLVLHAAGEAADKKGRPLLRCEPLDALLDYDDEDNREHAFEVALFAELFREMLQQRFGRAILRGLAAVEAAAKARRPAREEGGKAGGGGKKRERSASVEEDAEMADAEGGKDGEGTPEAAAKRAKTETAPEPTAAAAAAAAAGAAGAGAGGFVENLLTACRFYDRECAGYLADEDLEEIAYMVSDSLSRKRVQSLVDAVTKRSKFSYLEHAGLAVPPAAPPASSADGGNNGAGKDGPVVSDSGVVVIRGMAVDVPQLQQRLTAADAARRAAEDGQRDAEVAKTAALADRQRAQQAHEQAVLELAQAKEQLQARAATRSQADVDSLKARVVLQAAELGLQEVAKQLAEAVAALGSSEQKEGA